MDSALSTFNSMSGIKLYVYSLLTLVCVHLVGLHAEYQFQVWVITLDDMSTFSQKKKKPLVLKFCLEQITIQN